MARLGLQGSKEEPEEYEIINCLCEVTLTSERNSERKLFSKLKGMARRGVPGSQGAGFSRGAIFYY